MGAALRSIRSSAKVPRSTAKPRLPKEAIGSLHNYMLPM